MKNRKINFIKLGMLLFGISIILWNCREEQFTENKSETPYIQINAKTISFKEAINHFNSKKKKIQQKGVYARRNSENTFNITPNWNTLRYNKIAYTDANLTTADAKINRDGNYDSQLYFINVNGNLKNVIFTIWKDKIDQYGNIINGRIYFNDLQGKFIDGYRIKNGVFSKRFIIKTPTQKASFLPLSLFQDLQESDDSGGGGGDCWNTDNLPNNGVLDEVVIRNHNTNWYFKNKPGLGGGKGYSYSKYINKATNYADYNGMNPRGVGGNSLSSGQVTSAAAVILMVAPIKPNKDGTCPEGYRRSSNGDCETICTGGKYYNTTTKKCECPNGTREDSYGNCIDINVSPCKYIKLQIQNPIYTNQANELKRKVGLKKETGYKQNKDGKQIPLKAVNNGHSLIIPVDRNTVGYMHTHINNYNAGDLNDDGIDDIIKPIRMFSPADVIQFLKIVKFSKYNGVPTHLVYGTMISSTGTYTLRFRGSTDNIKTLKSADDYEEDYKTYFKEKYKNNVEKAFLHFLKDFIKIEGIKLYRIGIYGKIEQKILKENGKVDTKICK